MKNYLYQNTLVSKKQLKQLLAWSFTKYDSMQACSLADELKYLGFKYASKAGISISIEDLKYRLIKTYFYILQIKKLRVPINYMLRVKLQTLNDFKKLLIPGT
jgi:DNA-directed RNA polymerase subunit beta'